LVGLGIVVLAATGAVATLNATVFGAGAFVRVYLDALARGDVTGALSLPGVTARGVDGALLRDGTLAGLRNIHQLSDDERGGEHIVTVGWSSPEGSGSTAFEVKRIGTRFGLFPEWGFAISPVATVTLNVEHDARFTLNGHQEVSSKRDGLAANYAVLVPGAYVFGHQSTYLAADPDPVLVDTVGENLGAVVDVEANTAFVAKVSKLVDAQLAVCAKQPVLFPSGCSFGQTIDNRVSSAPAWSIVSEPRISIVPGEQFGTWAIPSSAGTAHLKVQVTSLYDGTVSTFDQDVPFTVEADIQLGADDSITVFPR
jgi:hypothetical protein